MIEAEPGFKYAPFMTFNTFVLLLKTDMKKALNYGKVAITTPTYTKPAFNNIISAKK